MPQIFDLAGRAYTEERWHGAAVTEGEWPFDIAAMGLAPAEKSLVNAPCSRANTVRPYRENAGFSIVGGGVLDAPFCRQKR